MSRDMAVQRGVRSEWSEPGIQAAIPSEKRPVFLFEMVKLKGSNDAGGAS